MNRVAPVGGRRVVWMFGAAVLLSCGKDTQAPAGPMASELRIRPPSVELQQLDSTQVVPSVLDANGVLMSGVPVTFQSADPAIATVSNVGVITSTGPAGATTITARALTLTTTIPVTVRVVATKLTLEPSPGVVEQKATLQLTARLLDRTNTPVPSAPITWTSSDTTILRVSTTGLATSVGPAGQVAVTARSGDFFATSTVAVTQLATAIRVSPGSVRIGRGRTIKLAPQLLDAVGVVIPNFTTFSYSSLNPSLVTVSADGVVTAASALGIGSIRITAVGTPVTLEVPVEVLAAGSPAGTSIATLAGGAARYSVAVADGDSVVGVSANGEAVIAHVPSGRFRVIAGGTHTLAVTYDNARNSSYIASYSGAIRQVNHTTGVTTDLIMLPGPIEILSIVASPDGRTLYAGANGGAIHIVDVQARTSRVMNFPGTLPLHLILHPDGQRLYASGNGALAELNLQSGHTRNLSAPNGYWQASAISSDGKYLFVVGENSFLAQLDLTTNSVTNLPLSGCGGWGMAITRDDRFLYIACSGGGTVVIYDILQQTTVRHTGLGEVRRVAMSLDGSLAAIASGSGVVVIR